MCGSSAASNRKIQRKIACKIKKRRKSFAGKKKYLTLQPFRGHFSTAAILIPTPARTLNKGKYQSGQMGQTVNLLAYAFGGSNPSLPTRMRKQLSWQSTSLPSWGSRVRASFSALFCCYSSAVEHFLGKEEVVSSSLTNSSFFVY